MTDTPDLFADLGYEPARLPVVQETPERGPGEDARRTARRNAMLAKGIHPVANAPLREPVGEVCCRDCANKITVEGHARTYIKCLRFGFDRGSAATDIRAKWPACIHFQPRSQETPR